MKALLHHCAWLSLVLMVSACAGANEVAPVDPSLNDSNSAKLFLYRPNASFRKYDPEKPFFYANGQFIGQLGVGEAIIRRLKPGKTVFVVRASMFFVPGREQARAETVLQAGKTYYLRYSYDLTGIVVLPNAPILTGSANFHFVDQDTLNALK